MSSTQENTWKDYFANLGSNEVNNQALAALYEGTSGSKSIAECVRFVEHEKETVSLLIRPIFEDTVFVHNFVTIGGTRLNPTKVSTLMAGTGGTASMVAYKFRASLGGCQIE